jgi:hypothetical protein
MLTGPALSVSTVLFAVGWTDTAITRPPKFIVEPPSGGVGVVIGGVAIGLETTTGSGHAVEVAPVLIARSCGRTLVEQWYPHTVEKFHPLKLDDERIWLVVNDDVLAILVPTLSLVPNAKEYPVVCAFQYVAVAVNGSRDSPMRPPTESFPVTAPIA